RLGLRTGVGRPPRLRAQSPGVVPPSVVQLRRRLGDVPRHPAQPDSVLTAVASPGRRRGAEALPTSGRSIPSGKPPTGLPLSVRPPVQISSNNARRLIERG